MVAEELADGEANANAEERRKLEPSSALHFDYDLTSFNKLHKSGYNLSNQGPQERALRLRGDFKTRGAGSVVMLNCSFYPMPSRNASFQIQPMKVGRTFGSTSTWASSCTFDYEVFRR